MPGHFDSFGIQIQVCYVAVWDEVTVSTQESAEHRIGEDGFIGDWLIVVVRDLPFTDQRLNGKILKLLAHRLFPHSKYSIWVDLKSQFRCSRSPSLAYQFCTCDLRPWSVQ